MGLLVGFQHALQVTSRVGFNALGNEGIAENEFAHLHETMRQMRSRLLRFSDRMQKL